MFHLWKLSIRLVLAACACLCATSTLAANVQFRGTVTYSCAGGLGILQADRVENFDYGGYSGTLHMELWAATTPYTGVPGYGYKLAQHSLGQLNGGWYLYSITSGTVFCTPPPNGTWYVFMLLTEYTGAPYNGGYDTRDWINFSEPLIVGPPPPPPPPANTIVPAVEYYHAGFDHYFVTADANEIAKLDAGIFVGWTRTGQSFQVYSNAAAGSVGVCRFFSTSFAPKSSHFYTPDNTECASVKANYNWQYEAVVFNTIRPNSTGTCPSGTLPVYRLYNNGQGGAPNHRYTTNITVRAQMLARGWIPEGYGALGVMMCNAS